MDIFVKFNNRQLIDGEITSESILESVGVFANGTDEESVAQGLMDVIECLAISSREVIHWLLLSLDSKDLDIIREQMLSNAIEGSTHEIAMRAIGLLSRDEQEKIATDILSQWGEDIVSSVGTRSDEGECDAAM